MTSYIFFLAAGQRAQIQQGRYILGTVCLIACLSVFFVIPRQMFVIQAVTATLFYVSAGVMSALHSWQTRNLGDALLAIAGLVMLVGIPFALSRWLQQGDLESAQRLTFSVYSAAYVLVTVGFLASVVIEYQQKLNQMTTEDPLTQLLNRRGLEHAVQVTIAHASRQQSHTAAVLIDIDHFEAVNSNFGHDAGDQIILQVGEVIQQKCRTSDVLARTGGGEFLLVLPETDLDGARILAERIREDVSAGPMVANQQRIPVTVSLGVAGAVGEIKLDTLSGEAGRAMNLAKMGGRNRVASVENKPVYLSSRERRG
ncbi:MAG: GGDEF domain-containing protein [Proteobacteria bacterium]|nr:GGDEF domain-containing protein [Pseudomonadota bacterium]